MTAVVTQLKPQRQLRAAPAPAIQPARRPSLVVLEGGRSAAGMQRRATYRRRRIGVLVALAAAVLVLSQLAPAVWSAVSTPPTTASAPSALEISGPTYVAQAGDTLWDVARAVPSGGDVRDRVDRLAEANGTDSLVVGQTVQIPADLLAS